jgi:hypothetical protein
MFMASKERARKPGVYHATEIINPPQAVYWGRRAGVFRHPDDLMGLTFGSAVHHLMEEGGRDLDPAVHVIEDSFGVDLETPDGPATLRMTPDYYDTRTKTLTDYKTAGAFSLRFQKKEILAGPHWQDNKYFAQMNIYRAFKFPEAVKARLFFFALGWDKSCQKEVSMFGDRLPPVNVTEEFGVPLAPPGDVRDWATRRVAALVRHEKEPETIPNCTLGDKWDRGRGPTKCHKYCDAKSLCPQYARENGGR